LSNTPFNKKIKSDLLKQPLWEEIDKIISLLEEEEMG